MEGQGEIEHTFDMPSSNLSLTATYAPVPFGNTGGTPECRVVRIADSAVITFSGDLNGSSVNLRRNSAWIQNVSGFDYYVDADDPPPNAIYKMRVRDGGAIGYTCSTEQWPPESPLPPESPPAPAPPAPVAAACVVEVINNVPVVSYSDFTNVSTVVIRRNGRWIVTDTSETPGAGTYEDTSAVPGVPYSYEIRTRSGGVVTDLACTPAAFAF